VAVKVVRKQKLTSKKWKMAHREVEIHRALSHQNVCRMLEHRITKYTVYLTLEYCHVSLWERVTKKKTRPVTTEWVRRVVVGIVEGLTYVHKCNVIHRDIKPQNILLDAADTPKISDFGLAAQGPSAKGLAGTPNYMAPEIVRREEYTCSVDVWSLGCCIVAMFCSGKCPFSGSTVEQTLKNVCLIHFTRPIPKPCRSVLDKVFVPAVQRCDLRTISDWALS
jgi:serine/threonine protein kinase